MKKIACIALFAPALAGCHSSKARVAERPIPELMDVTVAKGPAAVERRQLEASLHQRIAEMEELRDSLNSSHVTKFSVYRMDRNKLADGRYETRITLKPDGGRTVPAFSVKAKAKSGSTIKSLDIAGSDLDGQIYTFRKSDDGSAYEKMILSVPAEDLSVRIVTAGEPGGLEVQIDPLE